jgi:hypothetical protein
MWKDLGLFATKPPNVINDAMDTMKTLEALRAQKVTDALNKIKLQYAPQMAKQGADLGAANVSIKQNEAKYAPQMSMADLAYKHAETVRSYAASKGEELDNVIRRAKANHADESVQNDLQIQRAQLGLLQAQAAQASSKAKALSGAPVKGAPVYLDPLTGTPVSGVTPQQAMGDTAAVPSANDNESMTAPESAPSQPAPAAKSAPSVDTEDEPEETFPGANPKAMNVLAPVGVPDSRGHPVALQNLRTGERFAVLTPQGREKSRIQLSALRQAIPYMDDLVKLGTVGAVGPTGKNELIPNWAGGVPRGVGAKYDATLNKAVEHVIAGSNLKQTETTLPMIHAVLNRQNWESRQDYTDRMNEFKHHLQNLEKDTTNSLGKGYMSLDKYNAESEQKYLENQYNKITKSTVDVISPDGREATVPRENLEKALARGYRKA